MSAREILKNSDYERYVFSLFLPARLRPGAWAVLALNAELSAIAGKAHEPLARAMRLVWWREQLEALYAGAPPRHHDILLELAPYVIRGDLPKKEWDRLLEAYGRQMEGEEATGDTVAPWLHLLAALDGAYEVDYDAREAWGQGVDVGIAIKKKNLKKSTKKNINATLFQLTSVSNNIHASEKKNAECSHFVVKTPRREVTFLLRFWWCVLLTKW